MFGLLGTGAYCKDVVNVCSLLAETHMYAKPMALMVIEERIINVFQDPHDCAFLRESYWDVDLFRNVPKGHGHFHVASIDPTVVGTP